MKKNAAYISPSKIKNSTQEALESLSIGKHNPKKLSKENKDKLFESLKSLGD